MKILMVSSFLPYPLYSGGQVRLFNLIRELSGRHDITLVCEKRSNQTKEDVIELEKYCKKVITVDRRKQWSIQNILKSAVSKQSFLINGHTHQGMKQAIISELEKNKYDLIHVETFYVMQNLPKTDLSVVLVEHNVEYMVYRRYLDKAPIALKPFIAIDVAKMKTEEESSWKSANRVVTVSNSDSEVMRSFGITAEVVANGVDTNKFDYKIKSKGQRTKSVLFIGDFKWIQNKDAAIFIINNIWPKIGASSDLKLWIVGRSIPASIKNLTQDPNVLFDEESAVWPTEKIFQSADILLAPIRVGGGTSYKILESMSCGTPVVASGLSAESIEALDRKNIMIGETADDFAAKIRELLKNEELYNKIQKGGRELVEQNYTWNKIGKKLENVYESLV